MIGSQSAKPANRHQGPQQMSDEKTEQPTDKKLEDARRDGETSKSTDLPAAVLFLAGSLALSLASGQLGEHFSLLMRIGLDVGRSASPDFDLTRAMMAAAVQTAWILLPVFAVAFMVPLLVMMAQVGINISFKPLEPKFSAINPASGIKRLFSIRSLIDLVKMTITALVLFAVLYKLMLSLLPVAAGLAYQTPLGAAQMSMSLLCKFLSVAGFVYLVVGSIDFGVQKWLFVRDHRMSKDEIKREYKESEGDPEIKGKRKQIAREMAEEEPVKNRVAGAQAVIVNPTHYAVAIRYAPEEHGLPRVVAKGVDDEAMKIRALAEAAGVPILPNPPLARALYLVPEQDPVPEPLFEAVAEILAWVNQLHGEGYGPSAQ